MAAEVQGRAEEPQDLAGIVSRYRRHVPLIATITIVMIVLAGVGTYFLPKKYSAVAELTYAPQSGAVQGKPDKDPVLSDQARDAQIDAQIQLLKSLPVARAVVLEQHLDRDPDILAAATALDPAQATPAAKLDAMALASLNNLRVRRVGQTPLFDVTYTDKSPLQSAQIANSFAKSYLTVQVLQKVAQSKTDSSQLTGRITTLRHQVEEADAAVATWRRDHNLLTTPDSPVAGQELATVNQQLAEARAAQAESAARAAAVGRTGDVANTSEALASPVIAELRRQQAEVGRKVADLSARYGPRYPDLVDAQQELKEINQQLAQELQRVQTSLRSNATVADQRTSSVLASRAATQAKLAGDVGAGVMLADLTQRATTARTIYEALLASSGQADAAQALSQPDAQLTSPASPPVDPSSPNLAINLLLGAAVGIAIGVGIAFLRERWSVGLNTIDDIDRLLDQNYLNTIPTLASSIDNAKTKDPVEAISVHPLSLFTEAFRSLAASLRYAGRTEIQVIGITSALPKEGKSTTSAAVAKVLAMAGSKVLLIDADLRRRSVTTMMCPEAAVGMIEVLDGKATLAEALIADPSGMTILPLAPHAHVGTQRFDSPAFDTLMAQLRRDFDVIVVDTAPVLAVVDTRLLLRHLDALALLARWRQTPIKAIRAAIHQIESVGGTINGVAMTMVNLKTQQQSGYGDSSYYYREMKDYYVAAE